GSGSVIHGMHEEQDIMKMGGLKKHMPKTFATFAIGTAAISGFPLLSGFFSKDDILWSAFSSHVGLGGPVLWCVMALTAFMTAFYMMRVTALTFLGKERFDHHHVHPHESPMVMVLPLIVLAILSVVGGYVGFPHHSWIEHWLSPVVGEHAAVEGGAMEWVLMATSVVLGLGGLALGYFMYVVKPELPKRIFESAGAVYNVLYNKYYVDELYDLVIVRPTKAISMFCWRVIDVIIVDGTVLAFGRVSRLTGEVTRLLQTGAIQTYAVFILLGLTATVGYLIYGIHH
ncbi:MAG: NADH-quinone oxidoreductase subunit L, partial [Deltaproteobacteria bacterium]|nr:NADH-quinone oxidoreductase subunit L [Deltaproteobacteria bacterium]